MRSIHMRSVAKKLQKGATMIEYALLASLVAVAAVVALTTVGTEIKCEFSTVIVKLGGAAVSGC